MLKVWIRTGYFAGLSGLLFVAGCASNPQQSQSFQADPSLTDGSVRDETQPAARSSPDGNLLRLARDIEARGSVATALPLYERAAERPEAGVDVYVALGNAYAKVGRNQDAASSFRKALAKEPDNSAATFGLGSVLMHLGEADRGVQMLSAVVPRLNTPEAYDRLGVAHMMAGQPREALASFEQAYSLNRKDPDIATNLTLAAALLSEYGRSGELAQQTLSYPDVKTYHRRNIILALAISGKFDDARRAGLQIVTPKEVDSLIERGKAIGELSEPRQRALALGTIQVAAASRR